MANKIEELTIKLAQPILDRNGFELIDCEYVKIGQEYTLTLYIDKPGGIMLDDCELVSRELDALLDNADPIENEYILSVSSPGLDRALKTEKDFQRNMGKKIFIKTYRAVDKKKEHIAVLKAYDDDTVTVEMDKKELRFNRSEIAVIRQHIDF